MSSRHIVIIGDAADELEAIVAPLRDAAVDVTLDHHDRPQSHLTVTTFVIAARLSADMDWDAWWRRDDENRAAFETVLPHLASSSNGMLLGFSDTDDRSQRADIRSGMASLIARFQAHAAADRGVDFSMNGIEMPATFDRALLLRRLQEHSTRRGLLANEAVVRFEELADQTIAQAMTSDFI